MGVMTHRRTTERPTSPTQAPVVIQQAPAGDAGKRTTLPYLGAPDEAVSAASEADGSGSAEPEAVSNRTVSEVRGRYAIIHGRDREAG